MPENSVAKPAGPDEVEEEFMETLRQAVFIFEREKDGRFHGSIFACKGGLETIQATRMLGDLVRQHRKIQN
jgi:hypothetical protein